MNYKELLGEALQKQENLVNTAKAEERDLNEAEQAEFDKLQADIDGYKKSIEADEENARKLAIEAERKRSAEINDLCRDFNMDASSFIKDGSTVENVKSAILDNLKKGNKAVPMGGVNVTVSEADKFRAAATDGLLMRSGLNISKPADGANDFRGMSLRDLAIECLSREGENANTLLRMDRDELYAKLSRAFTNPSASFPAIMDAAIKKQIVDEYQKVQTTFDIWTKKGSVTDFKATPDHSYVLGGVGDFELVPENGELKNSVPQTYLLPQRKIDTYGKQFSMSRQAFINDDIGFITEVPKAYTRAAKRTIDKAVYKVLIDNSTIYDSKALFHADHKNLISSGAAPSQTTIQNIILLAQGQTDPFDEPIYEVPKYLVVPMGYEFVLSVIFHSAQVVGSANNDINPLYNYPIKVVQSPWINSLVGSGNAMPWFMVTDPGTSKSIQVDYLNGRETPTFRRSEPTGQLGFVWDIWLDWGITVVDYRGIYKNPGTTL